MNRNNELLTAVRDHVNAATAGRLTEATRLSRLRTAAARAEELRAVTPLVDPYDDGEHDRIRDAYYAQIGGDPDAAERLDQHRQAEQLRASVSGLYGITAAHPSSVEPIVARWLAEFALPAGSLNDGQLMLPDTWTTTQEASIDAAPGTEIAGSQLQISGDALKFRVASFLVNASRQTLDWTVPGEIERGAGAFVSLGLERALLADLTAGLVPAADFDTTESTVGAAWPVGADVILCHGSDRPAIRKAYAGVDVADRPRILATGGATAGIAVVLASTGIYLEASGIETMTATNPAVVGEQIALLRWGRVHPRVAGAVATVAVA